MSYHHPLQEQRFEIKYLIPESLTGRVRDFVSAYLQLDEFAARSADFSYPIHNIYLDSPDLKTYRASLNGDKNRYKLRLRFYNDKPHAPVFFEIKRRMSDIIRKQRCGVRREAIPRLLAGHLPQPENTLTSGDQEFQALHRFCSLMNDLQARPVAHLAYAREAWVSASDNSVRVTMDRAIRCEPRFSFDTAVTMKDPVYPFDQEVILELKFTNRFPHWFNELVSALHLVRSGGAKYVGGVQLKGEEHYSSSYFDDRLISAGMVVT
jgi:SPX domain protein involved in polyphosphate accumulation